MATNHGSIEFLKFPNPSYPGDTSQMIKKWLRDSWARRKIVALQQAVAAIVVPTKTSDLTNDSGFITSSDIPTIPSASTSNPVMDGTASPGTSTAWSRGDHVHPTDTSRQAALSTAQMNAVNSGITAAKVTAYDAISVPSAYTSNPAMDGTASSGSSTSWARGDHVHPHDTSKQDALNQSQLSAIADISATSAYTLTRTNNSYVNATDFARIYVYKVAPKLAIMVCNLKLSAQFTASNFVEIGTISGISLVRNHIQGINGQNAVGHCLMLQTDTTGAISIYSLGSATGEWFRAIIPLVLS